MSVRGRPISSLDASCTQWSAMVHFSGRGGPTGIRVGGQRALVVGEIVADGERNRQPSCLLFYGKEGAITSGLQCLTFFFSRRKMALSARGREIGRILRAKFFPHILRFDLLFSHINFTTTGRSAGGLRVCSSAAAFSAGPSRNLAIFFSLLPSVRCVAT